MCLYVAIIYAIFYGDVRLSAPGPDGGIINEVDLFKIYSKASIYYSVNLKLRALLSLLSPIFEFYRANDILFNASQRDFASYKIVAA